MPVTRENAGCAADLRDVARRLAARTKIANIETTIACGSDLRVSEPGRRRATGGVALGCEYDARDVTAGTSARTETAPSKVTVGVADELRVGDPTRWKALTIFPLFYEGPVGPPYRLLIDAVEAGDVTVEERGVGTVPALKLVNRATTMVLITQGEELVGGKQNRIVNVSLLVPPKAVLDLPVSCVEAGRWRTTRRTFRPSQQAFPRLRRAVAAQVARSVAAARVRWADQAAVWEHVDTALALATASTRTRALDDAFRAKRSPLRQAERAIPYVEGAAGLACAIGGRLVYAEFFDRPEACRRMWQRLVRSAALEAALATSHAGQVSSEEVAAWLRSVKDGALQRFPAIGIGDEVHLSGKNIEGSLLMYEGVVIHATLFRP
ncbi:MAG TPA: DUF6569 family protein [Dehalococcoidia bacterium]|nr:DUF6569 family protein [Dehalococcoidia bacterium]